MGPRGYLLTGSAAALVVLLLVTAWGTCGFKGCPDPSRLGDYQPGSGPVLLDREGEEIGRLHPLERHAVSLDSLPEHVPGAFLAVEDRRFHRHRGVDWIRVVGAAFRNLGARRLAEGASTVSMQLARTGFPDRIPGRERTIRRKLVEVRAARAIERRFEKDEILELYLNHIYLGGGAYGVQAAARHYFDRPASRLSPEEAALLAALARSPGYYDPRRDPERARARRDLVLQLMEEEGHLSQELMETARSRELGVVPDPPAVQAPSEAPYFVQAVRGFLEDRFGEELYQSHLRVHTTLDLAVQEAAEAALLEGLAETERRAGGPAGELQGAVVSLDPFTGAVRGLVGGRDFTTSRFNRATAARRQLGSAFKPFVVAAALEEGFSASQPVADRPLRVDRAGSGPWVPRNYDNEHRGTVSVREALVESLNIPTARLALAVGMERVTGVAARAGIGLGGDDAPAAALGTVALSPMDVATGYATLAAGGHRPTPHKVTRVEWEDGTVLYESTPDRERVLDEGVAHIVKDMLTDVVERGTGVPVRTAGYRGPAAGKTGTTQGARDAWFAGFTDELATAVWVGHDEARPIHSGATGGSAAAPIWGELARRTAPVGAPDRSALPGPRPPGVVELEVDAASGRVVEEGCGPPRSGTRTELFLAAAIPEGTCPESRNVLRRIADRLRGGGGDEDPRSSRDGPYADRVQRDPTPVSPRAPVGELLGENPLNTRRAQTEGAAGPGDEEAPER